MIKDWRYKIGFDKKLREDIQATINSFPTNRKDIYQVIFDSYKDIISFHSLVLSLSEKSKKEQEDIVNNLGQILQIPKALDKYYLDLIFKNYKKDSEIAKQLVELLFANITENYTQKFDFTEMEDAIFGRRLRLIKLEIDTLKVIHPTSPIARNFTEESVRKMVSEITKDNLLKAKFGDNILPKYDIKIQPDSGFGNWDSKTNTLKLFKNMDSLKEGNLKHIIYKEVYPGRGNLFSHINKDTEIDFGAIGIVEGWSIYSQWYFNSTLKEQAKRYLDFSLGDISPTKKLAYIYRFNRDDLRLTRDNALHVLAQYSQLPHFLETAYLGAFCIEAININPPIRIIEELNNKKFIGDIFNLI